ncbi:hypothetical protein A0J61_08554, partial [Choanephora cucurbitarum]
SSRQIVMLLAILHRDKWVRMIAVTFSLWLPLQVEDLLHLLVPLGTDLDARSLLNTEEEEKAARDHQEDEAAPDRQEDTAVPDRQDGIRRNTLAVAHTIDTQRANIDTLPTHHLTQALHILQKKKIASESVESIKNTKKIRATKNQRLKKSKKSKLASVGDQWGKYAWLIEVKNVNVETIGNSKRKELFADFMEDYNTATMPHEKFYNLHNWEKRQAALRMGEQPVPMSDTFDFKNDEERLRMQHRQAARASASRQPMLQLSEEKIKELARVNRERIEADRMRKMGLTPKEGMGVRYEDD